MIELINAQAREDFNKAKSKGQLSSIIRFLTPHTRELFSLREIKSIVKSNQETYRGLQVVQIKDILGSEDRYQDFSKTFLPRKEHLRSRWEKVDQAHLKDIILPPIKLFKLDEIYFVRDGNHRVSVARTQGVEAIDAEVVEISIDIPLTPDLKMAQIFQRVIAHERKIIIEETQIDEYLDINNFWFTEPGRYEELIRRINVYHKQINSSEDEEVANSELEWGKSARHFYDHIYRPVLKTIRERHLLHLFPGRTEADLFLWVIKNIHNFNDHDSSIQNAIDQIYADTPIRRKLSKILTLLLWFKPKK